MLKNVSLDEGVKKIFNLAKAVKISPVLISIHGDPNCGKTYLSRKLFNIVYSKNLTACRGQCEDEGAYFQNGPNPDYVFVEDALFTEFAEDNARKFTGKGIDIRVLIDNPLITGGKDKFVNSLQKYADREYYDVIIQNYNSVIK